RRELERAQRAAESAQERRDKAASALEDAEQTLAESQAQAQAATAAHDEAAKAPERAQTQKGCAVRFAADRPLGVAPATVLDYRELARRRLPRQLFDYIDGGAYEESTLRANVSDLERVLLRQIVMRDVSTRDPSVELFGQK